MYKLPDAARLLGRSSRWVRDRVAKGELEAFLLPNMVIPGQAINKFLEARRYASTSSTPNE